MENKSAIVVGAGGLVGSELLQCLLNAPEYTNVCILVRKPLGISHPKLTEVVISFDEMAQYKDCFKVHDVFCCLGTTIKKAGSQEAFKKVDVDYPLEMASLAQQMQAEKFLVISSMGADPKSKVFYSRMKGLLEQTLRLSGLQSLFIFRPSLLLGERKEHRLGEKVAAGIFTGISFLFVGKLKKYKAIEAKTVARGMYKAAQLESWGVHIYLSDEIDQLAN